MTRGGSGLSRVRVRPGEGAAVPLLRKDVRADGSTELSLDLGSAPVPERRYVADAAWVSFDGFSVQLLFGQTRVVGDSLRSLLVVKLFPDAVRNFLKSCASFGPRVREYLARTSVAPVELHPVREEPVQTVAMVVNIIAAAQAGMEATLDCYHISADALRTVTERETIPVDAIVRIDVSAPLLVAVLDALEKVGPQLPEGS